MAFIPFLQQNQFGFGQGGPSMTQFFRNSRPVDGSITPQQAAAESAYVAQYMPQTTADLMSVSSAIMQWSNGVPSNGLPNVSPFIQGNNGPLYGEEFLKMFSFIFGRNPYTIRSGGPELTI
jgi:hypothetical protein